MRRTDLPGVFPIFLLAFLALLPARVPAASADATANTAPRVRDATAATALRVQNAWGVWGHSVSMTVALDAQGIENAVGFSVKYDNTLLTFASAAKGSGATGATLNVNDLQTASGRVGIALALPAGQTFSAGTRAIVVLTFTVGAGSGTTTRSIDFVDQPIAREVSDALAETVTATYTAGTLIVQALPTFTDSPLTARVTAIKATHVAELRQSIAELRARYGLTTYSWTDATLASRTTLVKAAHVTELRSALAEVYSAVGRTPPTYSTPAIVSRTTVITAPQIEEIRAAVLAVW
jgi:hypothetical protein